MKNWIRGTNAAIVSLAVIGIFIVLTVVLHSAKGLQWDLTKSKKFTLSDQTISALKSLKEPVHAISFTDARDPGDGIMRTQINDMLEAYHKQNSKFTYEEIDPIKTPSAAEQYKLTQFGVILFQKGDKTKTVDRTTLFNQGSSDGSYAFSGEEKFTQALISVNSNVKRNVYALSGHGEYKLSDVPEFDSGLQNEDYTTKDLNLFSAGKVPDDADSVIALWPQSDLSDQELSGLQTYLKGKGKLYLTLGAAPDMEKWKNWTTLMNDLGVKSEHEIVIGGSNASATDKLLMAPEYDQHPITEKLISSKKQTVLAVALALSPVQGNANYDVAALLHSSESSYAKKDINQLASGSAKASDFDKQSGDPTGPFALAYAVADKSGKPKAVIVGNSLFINSNLIDLQPGNRDFALNSVGWLQEQQNLITIRPREEEKVHNTFLTPASKNSIFYSTVAGIPLVFLLIGGFIWWRRRKG